MNKFEFIKHLLKTKKLSPVQREKIINLAAEELSNSIPLEERVKKIEDLLKKNSRFGSKSVNNDMSEANKSSSKILPRPQETFELLSKFSSTDGGIKNLTHSFNYGYITYEDLMSQCRKEYDEGVKQYPNVPSPILKRISEFAFSENPEWYVRKGTERVNYNIGWSEPNFIKWYKENHIHPAQDAKYNKEMITPFKETIQIRADLGNLRKLLTTSSKIVFGENSGININIDKSIDSAQFYTDVDNLGQAIYHIFIEIKKAFLRNFCDEVEIMYEIINEVKSLKIIHVESVANKNVEDENFLGGDLIETYKKLYGLCNYDILAKFPNGYFRKKILSDDTSDSKKSKNTGKWVGKNIKLEEKDVKGFTHELKFY